MDFSALTNDQLAILGCFGALFTCGLLVGLTYQFGPAGKKSTERRVHLPLQSVRNETPTAEQQRKAA